VLEVETSNLVCGLLLGLLPGINRAEGLLRPSLLLRLVLMGLHSFLKSLMLLPALDIREEGLVDLRPSVFFNALELLG